jgi:sugar phosphate isomerase/epimerase
MKLAFYTTNIADIDKAARLGFDGIALAASAFGKVGAGALDNEAIAQARRLCVKRFGPVAACAERRGLRVALENWIGFWGRVPFRPMNMGGSPDTWDAMFGAVSSPALGLEFDPSHLFWQGIDHIRALKEYRDRVYHVHAKDVEVLPERRYRGGINGDYYRFRIPGYGAINWTEFISILGELGYRGDVTIEHEDVVYGYGSGGDEFDEGLVRAWQVLNPLIHPTATRR